MFFRRASKCATLFDKTLRRHSSEEHGLLHSRACNRVPLVQAEMEPVAQNRQDESLQTLRERSHEPPTDVELDMEKISDLRAYRPRLVPPLSRIDRRRDDSETLMMPYWCPQWFRRIQRKFPWYPLMVAGGGGPWLSVRQSEVPNTSLWNEVYSRWRNKGDRYTMFVRCAAGLIALLVLFILNVVTSTPLQPVENVAEIWDWFHEAFGPINRAVHEHEKLFSAFMIVSSLMIDIVVCWTFAYWGLLGDSTRLPIAYGLLYGIRSLIRKVTILPFPQGYKWGYPTINGHNYHSLTVPFTIADDFFYSGHIGCTTLAAIEFFHNRCWWGCAFSIAAALVTVFLMCALRAHYMIDMLTGAALASWYHMIAQKLAVYIDQYAAFPPRPMYHRQAFLARARHPGSQQTTQSELKEVQPSQQETCSS